MNKTAYYFVAVGGHVVGKAADMQAATKYMQHV